MPDQLPLRIRMIIAAAGAVLLVGLSFVLLQYGLGYYKGGYRLTARFRTTVQGLDNTSDVKIRGVTVGQVTGLHLGDGGMVDVTLKMHSGTKVPTGVVAGIEPLSVFGPGYLALDPGADESTGPYLHGGDTITRTHTSAAFTNLLSHAGKVLDTIDLNALATVIHTVAQGVSGLGPQLGDLIDNTSTIAAVGAKHAPQIQQFLTDLSGLSQTLVDHTGSLRTTTGALNQVLPAINGQQDEVGILLDRASSVSGQLGAYLTQHRVGIGQLFDDGSQVLRVAYDQSAEFPSLLDVLSQFFGRVGSAVRLPGPGGVLIGAVHGDLISNVCANVDVSFLCVAASP